jgi:hypothetical protein
MKTNLPVLSSIGFKNHAQRCVYAAFVLKAAGVSSPPVTISLAVARIPAKAQVIAQTAKLARPPSVAVAASANTVGYGFGQLYLNSPAYPAGTPIPAISAKPASAEVIGVAAVAEVGAKAAVISPAITALPGYGDAITIEKNADYLDITAYFPIASSPMLLGSAKEQFLEITPATLTIPPFIGQKVSTDVDIFSNSNYIPATLEEYFRYWAFQTINESFNAGEIITAMHSLNGITTRCKKVSLRVKATNYNLYDDEFQLGKIDYWLDNSGGGGGNSESVVAP